MAFEKLGVGGILTFDDTQAMRAMTRTQRIFVQLKKSAIRLRAGMVKLGQGMRNLAIAGAGVGIAVGIGVKQAADFEHQMSAVGAVTGATGKQMLMLGKKALELGINTQFSATQSAKAMEFLGKASYNTGQIMGAISGLVNLAASEQMNLAQATQIATDTIGALNLKKSQTAEVADVLALASMKAQTGVAQLGEAMGYGAANAKEMGLNLYQTSATMALFAKAGIRGSRAGTAMNAVMRGMLGATKKSRDAMAALGIKMKDFYKDGKLNMAMAIKSIKQSLDKNFKNPLERNRKVLELFSIRGMTAFNVLAGQGGNALQRLSAELSKAKDMTVKGMAAKGAAAIMAARRMDNLKGSVTLLKSSLEAFSIIVSRTFLGSMKKSVKDFTARLNRLLKVMMALGADDSLKTQDALAKKFGKTTVQVALGIRDGLKMISDSISLVKDGIKKLAGMMGKHIGEGSTRQIVKVIVAFTGLLAVLAPLMASIGALKFLIGALFKVASGALTSLAALFWPLVIIAGILGLAFLALRKNGESFGQTFTRVFKQIYAFGKQLFYEILLPMGKILLKGIIGFFNQIKPALMSIIGFVRKVIDDLASIIKEYTVGLKSLWKSVAKTIAGLLIDAGKVVATVVKVIMAVLRPLWKLLVDLVKYLKPVFVTVIKFVMAAAKAIMGLIKKIAAFAVEVGKLIGSIITELRPVVVFLFAVVAKVASVLFPVLAAIFRVAVKIVGVMVRIATVMVKVLKPVIVFLLRAFKAVFKAAWSIAKAITKGIIWSIRQLAKALSGLVMMASKVSFLIPGVTKKELHKLSLELAKFGWDIKTPKRMARVEGEQMLTVRDPDWYQAAKEKRKAEKRKREKKDPCIDLKLNNKLKIDVPVKIGARQVAKATADHQDEIRERAGFSTKPWQKRQIRARAAVLSPFED